MYIDILYNIVILLLANKIIAYYFHMFSGRTLDYTRLMPHCVKIIQYFT